MADAQRRHPLRAVPFVVISRGLPEPTMGTELVSGVNKAIEPSWQQMQIGLAQLVPGGKRIVATESGHHIPTDQPAIVVKAIRGVVMAIAAR